MATYYLLIAATLLLMGIFSSKLSEKFGIPALILFLGIGMLAGSDGPGGLYFNNAASDFADGDFRFRLCLVFDGGAAAGAVV